eukprot:6979802-Pyramimonas_sp.AAC.1
MHNIACTAQIAPHGLHRTYSPFSKNTRFYPPPGIDDPPFRVAINVLFRPIVHPKFEFRPSQPSRYRHPPPSSATNAKRALTFIRNQQFSIIQCARRVVRYI